MLRHMLTHMPYRVWCPWWVTERGRGSQRRRAKAEGEDAGPAVAMDFCLYHRVQYPVVCLKCSLTVVVAAHVVRSQEVTPELVRLAAKDIDNIGHSRASFKSDNQPAMKRRVKELCTHPHAIEESPEYAPQSNR